jgi:hypothetical protein
MRVIYRKICHARYLYIKRNVEKVWGARYTLGARYLSKNTVINWIYKGNTNTASNIQHTFLCTSHYTVISTSPEARPRLQKTTANHKARLTEGF